MTPAAPGRPRAVSIARMLMVITGSLLAVVGGYALTAVIASFPAGEEPHTAAVIFTTLISLFLLLVGVRMLWRAFTCTGWLLTTLRRDAQDHSVSEAAKLEIYLRGEGVFPSDRRD